MAQSKLTEITSQHSALDMQMLSRKSFKWMMDVVAEIKNPIAIANSIVREKDRRTSTIRLGRLYCYYYDPKTKEDLDYYDRFPLVLVLEKYNDGFLGLNLHYLPYQYRVTFLKKLMRFAVLKNDDEIQRMRVTYDILSASKRFKEFRPCIKRYLYNHLKSRILTIHPEEWEVASLLPLQQFKKAKPLRVWKESVQEIRKQ
jgi:hypothetical protein